MKKCICRLMLPTVMLLAMCGEGFADVEINAANFPDEIFRNYVSTSFDKNSDSTLSNTEIASVKDINVSDKGISSLNGIEYFTALTSLSCHYNQLTALDVSNNTALTGLYCYENQLTTLDVSKNTALSFLRCDSNKLTALDLSKNTALEYLRCDSNKLTALDLSKNTALEDLICSDNKLTALDVSGCTALWRLSCHENQLTALDLSKNTALLVLACESNQLTALDLSKNTALTDLDCDFTIESVNNNFAFNIAAFMNAYKSLGDGLLNVDFKYYYGDGSEYGSLTLDQDTINANNVVNFTIPAGKTFRDIEMTLTYSNSTNKRVTVSPYSGSSSNTTITAPIITTSSLPFASVDVSYSAAFSAIGASPITWTLSDGTLPDGLSMDSSGSISGTPTTTGAYSFTVTASNSSGSESRLFSIIVPFSALRAPKITTTSLADGCANSPYGVQLTATGTSPLTWSVAQGSSLPAGFTLTESGYLYGTHTSADTTAFTVCTANSAGTDSQDLSLTFYESPLRTRPAILPEPPNPAAQGAAYTCQLAAAGTPPFTWTLAKGKLPAGLSMSDSGLITGTPTKAAAAKLALNVSNDYGKETRTLTLNICKLPEITAKSLKDATVDKKYTETVKGTGTKPLTWELEGTLPQGLPLFEADNAKITGIPSTNDTGMVRVTLSNPAGEVSKVFTLKVSAVLPKITPKTLKAGTYGKNYSAAIKIKGSEPITVFLSGDLPEGLTFDSSTGKITGTPSEVCTDRAITILAVNTGGLAQQEYSLTVKAVTPKITTKQLPDAVQGSAYSVALEATGTPAITWTAEGLPTGLSISTTGTISGTPTESGTFPVKVSAANSLKTVQKSYKLVVTASTTPPTTSQDTTPQAVNSQQSAESKTGYAAQNVSRHGAAIRADMNDVDVNDDVSAGEYSIVADLGTVSVDEAGMYDFTVTLSDDTHAGKELLYLAGSNEPSNDDAIAEFYDDTGEDISTVPENRTITVSVWLKKGITYTPSIAVKH